MVMVVEREILHTTSRSGGEDRHMLNSRKIIINRVWL
ncbi:unnamed protein product [Brassica oleracea var. botrytis]|uniref:(rape) hypothetical protein n=1 Tax=Brassica napus TaxID=3708 RepID=A0A816IVV4_BRANA|nr:unnamed protein product [Brassica napus]